MKWLHKSGETYIDGFEFKKLPRLDKGNEASSIPSWDKALAKWDKNGRIH